MIRALATLMRPHHWTKNVVCLAGVVFGGRLLDPGAWIAAGTTLILFCLASSAVYVLNDSYDRNRDRCHPVKRRRPIARGDVSLAAAAVFGALLAAISLAGGFLLGPAALVCLLLYLANNALYSVWLKHLPLLDVLCITLGFVLRLLAGIYVLGDLPTSWIILCTFFLAAFLGFCKRRAELCSVINEGEDARAEADPRPVLGKYSIDYLDFLVSSLATMTIMSYAFFTTTSGKNPTLIITLPIVFLAVMHYKRMVMIGEIGQEPDRIVFKDARILLCIFAWLVLFLAIWLGQIHLIR